MVPDEDIRKFNRFYKKTNKNCALFRRQLTGRKESCKLGIAEEAKEKKV